jgi:hypothetical protein
MLKPHRHWIKSSANFQKVEFKNFQKISILAHSAKNFTKVKISKILSGHTPSPCQISKESLNHKGFYEHFNDFLNLKEKFWDEYGAAMVRDRLMVSSAKMMLMNSSFTMNNKMRVWELKKLPLKRNCRIKNWKTNFENSNLFLN